MSLEILKAKKIEVLKPINDSPDDIFISCASFEERCLGAPKLATQGLCENLVLFRFSEENDKREYLIQEMNDILHTKKVSKRYHEIIVKHGKTAIGVLDFHRLCQDNGWLSAKNLSVSLDITTFTKSLLLEILSYLETFVSLQTLRFIYTVPEKYAHPEEGELSFGIKSLNILPAFWGGWSSIKDDLLIVLLGYEEMRTWSLINQFDANVILLFKTNPGSKPEWDTNCEKYNERLLRELEDAGSIPALDPISTIEMLEKHITTDFQNQYNIFISPMGTKPQTVGLFYYIVAHPNVAVNIVTTTPIEHNIPYYSWGIGETYEFFSPTNLKQKKK